VCGTGRAQGFALLVALVAPLTLSACGPGGGSAPGAPGGPADSTVVSAGSAGGSTSGAPAPALVPGALLHAPLGCPPGIAVVVQRRLGLRLAHPYTVVAARCDSGAGSPPSGVYLVAGQGPAASLTQTLVGPAAQLQVASLTATATGIAVSAAGYSRPNVPRCCPDLTLTLTWRAAGDRLAPVP